MGIDNHDLSMVDRLARLEIRMSNVEKLDSEKTETLRDISNTLASIKTEMAIAKGKFGIVLWMASAMAAAIAYGVKTLIAYLTGG